MVAGKSKYQIHISRAGSRTPATFKMERFVIIVNGWKPLTIITKCSILDVAAFLDPPLYQVFLLSADYGAFIVSGDVLFLNINIILKHDFKKLLNSLEFFLFNVRGMRNIVKL